MNYLIINPHYVTKGEPYHFPLGLAYISSSMKKEGFNVVVLNLCHYDTSIKSVKTIIGDYINSHDINVVCSGGKSIHYNHISHIFEVTKEIDQKIITICGGAIITSDANMAIEHMAVDFGITYEGEISVVKLANYLEGRESFENLTGVVYRDENNSVKFTKPAETIEELDEIPFPDYEGFGFGEFVTLHLPFSNQYYTVFDEVRPAKMITTRSCPFSCTFCYHPLGKKYRQRSLDNVFEEIDYLVQNYRINHLEIYDELFSVNKSRMLEFAKRIKPYNLVWFAQFRVSDVNEEILSQMKDSGLIFISYGIESMSDVVLKSMKKKIKKEQIEKALKITRNLNIGIQGNLIFGDIEETEETVQESLDFWFKHPEYGLNLGMIMCIPDAPIYQYALQNGFIKDKFDFMKKEFPLINVSKMSEETYAKLVMKVDNLSYGHDDKVGEVISSKFTSVSSCGKKLYEIDVKCPSCQQVFTCKNASVYLPIKYTTMICRKCFWRFKIKTLKAFTEDYTLFGKVFFMVTREVAHLRTKYQYINELFDTMIQNNSFMYRIYKNLARKNL
jgi:radical SAM superfamily enzyme YgiQ (UPF0313 family)